MKINEVIIDKKAILFTVKNAVKNSGAVFNKTNSFQVLGINFSVDVSDGEPKLYIGDMLSTSNIEGGAKGQCINYLYNILLSKERDKEEPLDLDASVANKFFKHVESQ